MTAFDSTTAPVDRIAEIKRLAALDPLDYDVTRINAAKQLGIRVHVLDSYVSAERRSVGLGNGESDAGQGRTVTIPKVLAWHEPVGGDQIATTLAAVVKTYAVLPDVAADAIALWILHTWLVNAFMISPRLALTSPTKGCGKTTVLRLLNQLARRPKRAGSISPAALFRAVEHFQPTMLLDETEKYIEHGSDLHALINEGHCKGATVLRVLTDKQELREFAIFGAIAFARNGRLPDDLEQRSIIIEMQRRRADEQLVELREDRTEPLHRVARMCARWAQDNAAYVADFDPDMGMINRNADNWRVLFTIADMVGEDWPQRVRDSAAALTPRENESVGPMLLADIRLAFDEKNTDRLASSELCEALAAMEGRPWAEWRVKNASPKPISQNQLARLLKDFHVHPENIYTGGTKRPKGYLLERFAEAFSRFLEPQGVNEPLNRYNADEIRTSGAFRTAQSESGVADQKCEKPASNGQCSGLADQNGGEGLALEQCHHCHRPGSDADPLLWVVDGEGDPFMHRTCLNERTAGNR
jgi:hypothetical protein